MAAADASFRIYENVGFLADPTLARNGTDEAYVNTGMQPLVATKDGTFVPYENIGIRPGTYVTIVRQPRGWGVLPYGPQSITMISESVATAEAYENIQ